MEKVKLLLVGGFLGSGKTTAIRVAARYLNRNNKKVGTITNDQGRLQVDTVFMKGHAIPTEEVSAGCFCCQYDELEDRINLLFQIAEPDIVFAEPVGSRVDLAATVVNPLLTGCRITEYNASAFQPGYPRPTHRITKVI